MVLRSDKQRKAMFARLGTGTPVSNQKNIQTPVQVEKGFRRIRVGGISGGGAARSYIDGRRLPGKFSTEEEVFKKFPGERGAFGKVKRFQDRTGRTDVKTTNKIERIKAAKMKKNGQPFKLLKKAIGAAIVLSVIRGVRK